MAHPSNHHLQPQPQPKPLRRPPRLPQQARRRDRNGLWDRRHGAPPPRPPQHRPHRHSPVMPALKRNLKSNKPVLGKTLKTTQLYWTNSDQIKALSPPFDLVIATDVVYIEDTVAPLVSAMEALIGDTGTVLLGYQLRSPEAHQLFWEICGRVFDIQKVPHEHLHPEYAYEEADVYILRKKL
ncbi:Protein-lysine methyltransferase METTL21D [Camellia lanceoleosa]|uniref:Protein-lysine methyltransferase METTL21D n=1 Tax=Camellia lanceoleosa TaxID=1840588 RepID=A0ACC0HEU3_9ERIC|nr:Protein-lysine methyltransferase METTL21D [Camellia lanceoleosa]